MPLKPPKKNEQHRITLTDWADKGLAASSISGTPVLVPYAAPGDDCLVHITKPTPTKAYGKNVYLYTPSSDRVEAPCVIFGRCGGCQLQHVTYSTQLEYKKQLVKKNLEHAGLPCPPLSITGMTEPFYYRNKGQFSITKSKTGEILIGLSAPRSQQIIDCKTCLIQHPLTNQVLAIVRLFLEETDMPIFDPVSGTNGISHLITRVGVNTQSLMVAIASSDETLPHSEDLIRRLQRIPELQSVLLNHNHKAQFETMGSSETLLWGKPTITESIAGLSLTLSLRSFFQVNTSQIEVLWQAVTRFLTPVQTDVILDLYCGTGAMGLYLSRYAKTVIGIESHPEAIQNAEQNAQQNAIKNCQFMQGEVEALLPALEYPCDAIVVDPPRQGLSPAVIHSIIKLGAKKIVYVSCAPETLTRDLKILCAAGYRIDAVELVDLFGQTYHVETAVSLIKE